MQSRRSVGSSSFLAPGMAGNEEPNGYLSLSPHDGAASSSSEGEARPPGAVWSPPPRGGGSGPALPSIAGSESPVTQYVAAAVDEEGRPASPPQEGFFRRCFGCFRGGAGKADQGGGHGDRFPSPLPLYIPPAPHVGKPFIPPLEPIDAGKKTLVLDLDETLVHSSFKPVPNPDYIIPVEIDGKVRIHWFLCFRPCQPLSSGPPQVTDVYVLKRPWVDRFLVRLDFAGAIGPHHWRLTRGTLSAQVEVAQKFEVVVFTASLSKYADPLLDLLDKSHTVRPKAHPFLMSLGADGAGGRFSQRGLRNIPLVDECTALSSPARRQTGERCNLRLARARAPRRRGRGSLQNATLPGVIWMMRNTRHL